MVVDHLGRERLTEEACSRRHVAWTRLDVARRDHDGDVGPALRRLARDREAVRLPGISTSVNRSVMLAWFSVSRAMAASASVASKVRKPACSRMSTASMRITSSSSTTRGKGAVFSTAGSIAR